LKPENLTDTLVSGEAGSSRRTRNQVRGLILTDIQLANRLAVDERTVRKWKSGQTRMVFTTWCCLCWLAGLGMLLDNLSAIKETPDASENEASLVSPAGTVDLGQVVIRSPE
jgi:hypothetical protein